MKTNLNFTRGEWIAAVALLVIILFSYLFYFLYDSKARPPLQYEQYEAMFDQFNQQQAALQDSFRAAYQHNFSFGRYDTSKTNHKKSKGPLYSIQKIDINQCDTNDIVVIPQFGSKRAARLVEYRDQLGGFHSLSQVREVYILQDVDLNLLEKYFFVNPSDVKQININTATFQELRNHPYFDVYLTKVILNYRSKNGNITSLEQLQSITHAYPELMEKLKPYIVF